MNAVRQIGSQQTALPKVAVVIVNWNGEQFLDQWLMAFLAQTVKSHKIIQLDNASTDR